MAAISSVGTAFILGTGEILGTITAISFGGISTAEIDVTSLASTFKTYIMGTLDGGTITVSVDCIAGALVSMPTAGDATPSSFSIRFGTHAATPNQKPLFTFSGYVQNTAIEAAVDSQVKATYTIRVSSDVTVALSSV